MNKKLPGGLTIQSADFPKEFANAVRAIDRDTLIDIYMGVAKKVEAIVEQKLKAGSKYSTGNPFHRWGRNVFVRNLERTVMTFPNQKNQEKAYVVVGPKNINSGADRGTPVHHMLINGFRAKRGQSKAVGKIRGAQVSKGTRARALENAINDYPHRPAYAESNALAAAMFRTAFLQTDNEVVRALRTQFNVK